MKMSLFSLLNIILLLLFLNTASCVTEKFFEISGGPEYMYYFSKFSIGDPAVEQSAIIDTGSDTLAFPCDHCASNDCGTHQDPRFITKNSTSFKVNMHCQNRINYHDIQVCKFIRSYAEGSSLIGFLASDFLDFKNSVRTDDARLAKLNQAMKTDLKLKALFGCTTKETGLFKTQYADGILGLDNSSSVIKSMEENEGKDKTLSFGLCFHETGGIMSIDIRSRGTEKQKILNKALKAENLMRIPFSATSSYYEITVLGIKIKGFNIEPKKRLNAIDMMIDSGTTFSHFPDAYMKSILYQLNSYCNTKKEYCGNLEHANFNENSCIELVQPDDDYSNSEELLASFPDILISLEGNLDYTLKPKNYFYEILPDNPKDDTKGDAKICIAIKGHEQGRIILGAFAMIDYYFYFDRITEEVLIFKEDCKLRTKEILLLKERILSEKSIPLKNSNTSAYTLGIGTLLFFACISFKLIKRKKDKL